MPSPRSSPVTEPDCGPPMPGRAAARRLVLAMIAVGVAASACSAEPSPSQPALPPASQPTMSRPAPPASGSPSSGAPGRSGHGTDPGRRAPAGSAMPLAGKIVGIDPGHDGGNFADASYIGHQVWNGREWEACDTTGTETDGGYTEAQFNFGVARYLRADLRRAGATVVMTRTGNDGVGPCIDRRSEIINAAHARSEEHTSELQSRRDLVC